MKKMLAMALVISTLLLTGCATHLNTFKLHDTVDNISSIEIYYINPSYEKYIFDIDESFEPIKIVGPELYTEIANDLEMLVYKDVVPIFIPSDPNFDLFGFVIKVKYMSNVYQLVSNSGTVYTYDDSGWVDDFYGCVEQETWNELIIKYIGQETFNIYHED
ncbi:MAG: hypothetical protein E7676_04880 [Ruminococcaceae bacterium]|nr:hypothetical protein [Oscillospiraceae bacterium]MBE6707225.1 hypothetical protein [Oscillospiraceae bacterium]